MIGYQFLTCQQVIAALAALVFAFTPHLFTLAVTISFVLLASLFYPSRIVISLWKNGRNSESIIHARMDYAESRRTKAVANKADRKMLLEDTEMLIIYIYYY